MDLTVVLVVLAVVAVALKLLQVRVEQVLPDKVLQVEIP
jgi:hypothetical protein